MALSATTTNGAPTLSRTPVKDGGQFQDDVADFQAMTKGGIRYADNFGNADYGAKINAAIADLGARGGVVAMRPTERVDFSETVVTGDTPIVFSGTHIPTNESEGTDPRSIGTHLRYTGTGNAFEVSADDGETHAGFGFKGILLECSNALATGGIVFVGQAYLSQFENLTVDGPGKSVTTFIGIDIPRFTKATSGGCVGKSVKLRKCGIGLRLASQNASTWTFLACVFNNIGVQFSVTSNASGHPASASAANGNTFLGCWFEENTIGYDLQNAKQTTIVGGYNEDNDAGDRWIVAGGSAVDGRFCESLTIINPYCTGAGAGNQPAYFIELNRASNLTIIGGRCRNYTTAIINNVTTGTWTGHQVHGLSTEEDLPIWDDTGGVRITSDKTREIVYPNMPTADSGLSAGQLWSDGGTIKISAGS